MKRFIFLAFVSASVYGQEFVGQATIPPVPTDGFYRIDISSPLNPLLNPDFSNLRIHDRAGQEVPFIIQEGVAVQHTEEFKEYDIVEKKLQKGCCTSLLLHNPDGQPINNISLSIKNAEVYKSATLLGSDDKQNWFALKEQFTLSSINNPNQTSEIKIIDFPLSNYNFYWLRIDDSTSAPLNILKAGYYTVSSERGAFTSLPLQVQLADSAASKETYLFIHLDSAYFVDEFDLSMTGPEYFLRRASLYQKKTLPPDKKGIVVHYYEQLSAFQLSSKQTTRITLPKLKVSELMVVIENDDNPPLTLGSCNAYQLSRYLTAWLKKDIEHTLKIGSANTASPVYDLAFFKDKIPASPPLLTIHNLTAFEKEEPQSSTTIFTNPIIIWGAIIVTILILGFMVIKMVNESGSAQKSEE